MRSPIQSDRKAHRRLRRKVMLPLGMLKKGRHLCNRRRRAYESIGGKQSGDARRLFAPCDTLYNSNCRVKNVGMERIELLETVNCASQNWKTVVDTRTDGAARVACYSEADVFSLRFRSTYLAIALKQFLANVTGDMQTQLSWK
jgi:hypothetical protein